MNLRMLYVWTATLNTLPSPARVGSARQLTSSRLPALASIWIAITSPIVLLWITSRATWKHLIWRDTKTMQSVTPDCEQAATAPRRLDGIQTQRLVADHMFDRLGRSDDLVHVEEVGRRDVNEVDVRVW